MICYWAHLRAFPLDKLFIKVVTMAAPITRGWINDPHPQRVFQILYELFMRQNSGRKITNFHHI